MRSRRVLVTAAAVTAGMLTFGGTAQASVPSDAGTHATRVQAAWHTSNFTSNEGACSAARALYAANGYPTRPSSGCYRNDHGYYFLYWS